MHLFFLFCVCWIVIPFYSLDAKTGTLIVSYETCSEGERLDRIRFRLTQENGEHHLFPQGSGYACDANSPNRVVVIEHLAPGSYTVDFLIPSRDQLFEKVPQRVLEIKANETTTLHQQFHPCYATLKARVSTKCATAPFAAIPLITLKNEADQIKASSISGELEIKKLLPGHYTLCFEQLSGYRSPPNLSIFLGPNEVAGPFVGLYDSDQMQEMPPIDGTPLETHPCMT